MAVAVRERLGESNGQKPYPHRQAVRREATALHPKAVKGLTKHPYKPGQHGPTGSRKPSQYAVQLREKQKVKRMYGLLEKQFAKLVRSAERRAGNSGDNMLAMLETRFDNAVYRLGLAPSRQSARQLVTHGHFLLNGRRVDIPSIALRPGDTFSVRPKSAANAYFKQLAMTRPAKIHRPGGSVLMPRSSPAR